MYLDTANKAADTRTKEEWQQKAKDLITVGGQQADAQDVGIDTSNVLLLSALCNFPTGTTLIRERNQSYADIFRSFTSAKDTAGAISALRRYGPEDPSLYPLALTYFASSEKVVGEPGVTEELQNCLRRIDQERLMAPLQVVKILSEGGAVSMGLVKQYLADNIAKERKEIHANRTLVDNYRTETASKKNEIHELNTKPVVFKTRRCASCRGAIDLPMVHFLCQHSFHQRCLNSPSYGQDNDESLECPLCKPGNDMIKSIRTNQLKQTDQHDVFSAALERSIDRFSTVGDFFGAGVMNVTPAVD